jgi:hypothetical protein
VPVGDRVDRDLAVVVAPAAGDQQQVLPVGRQDRGSGAVDRLAAARAAPADAAVVGQVAAGGLERECHQARAALRVALGAAEDEQPLAVGRDHQIAGVERERAGGEAPDPRRDGAGDRPRHRRPDGLGLVGAAREGRGAQQLGEQQRVAARRLEARRDELR